MSKPSNYNDISLKSLELINNFVQKWMKHNYAKDWDGSTAPIPYMVWEALMSEMESVYENKWAEGKEDIND
jgi:hypothetical protein